MQEINCSKAKELLSKQDATFIDVRNEEAFNISHISGAIHVNQSNINEFIEKTDKTKPLIVYCYHGNTSRGVSQFLFTQGFTLIYSLQGGFEDWEKTFPDEVAK